MRLSDLLEKPVIDIAGQPLGRVHDVRLRQDGPINAGFDAALHVEGLIIGRGGLATRLGYGRTGSRGPWLVRLLLEARHKPSFVAWGSVRAIEADRIIIDGDASSRSRAEPRPAESARGPS
jgi:sporulation protein YlmC with PRC-barrel domain